MKKLTVSRSWFIPEYTVLQLSGKKFLGKLEQTFLLYVIHCRTTVQIAEGTQFSCILKGIVSRDGVSTETTDV
jgi:hypothetical protein